jgi:hypothetical protein
MSIIELPILGIDISKAKFDVALLVDGKVKKTRVFENNLTGFKASSLRLIKQDITHLQDCMVATGTYGDELANYLFDQGFEVNSLTTPALQVPEPESYSMLMVGFCLMGFTVYRRNNARYN